MRMYYFSKLPSLLSFIVSWSNNFAYDNFESAECGVIV
jgi:hypothetical protein